jgi:hypothetical protein
MRIPLLCAALSAAGLCAQDQKKVDARSFLPEEYNVEIYANVAALTDGDAWDVVERSLAKPLLANFRRAFGFDFAELRTVRQVLRQDVVDGSRQQKGVWLLEGGARVTLAKASSESIGWRLERSEVAGHEVLTNERQTWVSPTPGLVVGGDSAIVEATLRGERRGGVPDPELLALIAAPGAIAHVAGRVPADEPGSRDLSPIPAEWLDEGDWPSTVALRLFRAGETIRFEFRLGFQHGESGPAKFDAGFRQWLAGAKDDKQLAPFAVDLARVTCTAADRAFAAAIDLGQPEEAIGKVLQFALTTLPFAVRSEVSVEAVEAEPPPAPNPEKKK